jgi:hypothetical protein
MPAIEDQIDRAGGIIKAVAALIALVPFVGMLLGVVAIPPSIGQLIKGLTLAVSIIVILAIMTLSPRLAKVKQGPAAGILIAMALLGTILAVSYTLFAQHHIIAVGGNDHPVLYVVPLHPSPEIKAIMEPYGYDYQEALEVSPARDSLIQYMSQQDAGSTMLMVTLLILAEVMLVAAVVGGAWYLVSTRRAKRKSAAGQPPKTS